MYKVKTEYVFSILKSDESTASLIARTTTPEVKISSNL